MSSAPSPTISKTSLDLHRVIDSINLGRRFSIEILPTKSKRGILFLGTQNICYTHGDKDIKSAISAIDQSMEIMKNAITEQNISEFLEGKIVEPVFRKV